MSLKLPTELRGWLQETASQWPWQIWREQLFYQLAQLLWRDLPANAQPFFPLTAADQSLAFELPAELQSCWQAFFRQLPLWQRLHCLAQVAESSAPAQLRKQLGLFYTPPALVGWMVTTSLQQHGWKPTTPLVILDPACGSGLFLWAVMRQVWEQGLQSLPPSQQQGLTAQWLQNLHGCDLDELALQVCGFGLSYFWQSQFPGAPMPTPALATMDALSTCETAAGQTQLALLHRFPRLQTLELLLSNPPYVGEKYNRSLFAALKQGYWAKDYSPRGDLYYYFFYLALHLLQLPTVSDQALAAFVTPSYFFTASEARHLRQRLARESQLYTIVDFHELRLFAGAYGHHNQVCVFSRRPAPPQTLKPTSLLRLPVKGSFRPEHLALLDSLQPQWRSSEQLFQQASLTIGWSESESLQQALNRLEGTRLLQEFEVFQGIVSGADRVSARQLNQHPTLQKGQGIFVLSPQEAAPFLAQTELISWLKPWYKNSQISPWQAGASPQQWLLYIDHRQTCLPAALLEHLQPFRAILQARREAQLGKIPWYALQWPRQQARFEAPKLVLPQRAPHLLAAYAEGPWYASADVYFIQPRKLTSWTLKAVLSLLNSPLYACWFWHWGKRKGRLLELYQKPLSQLPLPTCSSEQMLVLERIAAAQPQTPEQWLAFHPLICELWELNASERAAVWAFYLSAQ